MFLVIALMPPPPQVPYMAASVRGEGAETIPGMMESLMLPPRPEDLEKYWSMGEDLAQGVEVRLALPVTLPYSLPPPAAGPGHQEGRRGQREVRQPQEDEGGG